MSKGIKSIVDNLDGGSLIDVECHITSGLPSVNIIGIASRAVGEAKDRLRASFNASGLNFPRKRIVINLAPGDIPKEGTSMDLAMAVSILLASKQVEAGRTVNKIFLGELSLDGKIRPIRGIIGKLLAAKQFGIKDFYIPYDNLTQASLVPDINITTFNSLNDIYLDLTGLKPAKNVHSSEFSAAAKGVRVPGEVTLASIAGQELAKRALIIAAAGRHNILLYGPPGTGKTMLAKALRSLLPPLDKQEMIEVTHLHSLGNANYNSIVTNPPFRAPHHSASTISLTGGSASPKPGEISLAHCGVLFLDELPEFNRSSIEALRQPLEERRISVTRIKSSVEYPANFMLIATQNSCPCGYYGSLKECSCSAAAIRAYQARLSGPIKDRIDIHVAVEEVEHDKLLQNQPTSVNDSYMSMVRRAEDMQNSRFGCKRFNSTISNDEIKQLAHLSSEAKEYLDAAAARLKMSARAYMKTIKVARTIADLELSEAINQAHIGEALQYREK